MSLKLEKEIEYLKIKLEWAKLNLEIFNSRFLVIFNILIIYVLTMIISILSFEKPSILVKTILILFWSCISLITIIIGFQRRYRKQLKKHQFSFIIQEKMIQKRYKKLYNVSKDNLDKEFEEIKKCMHSKIKNLF